MSQLLKDQMCFSRALRALLHTAHEMGYNVTMGDCYRDRRCHYGLHKSLHRSRLAADLNLFDGDAYLDKTSDHERLGCWWESVGGVWGGRFNDGNHYQFGGGLHLSFPAK